MTNASVSTAAAKIREGMIIVRILDGIVKNKYAKDPGKLAAWLSAFHIEEARRKRHQRHKEFEMKKRNR